MSIKFLRIAAYETQLVTSGECEKAANAFYGTPDANTTIVQKTVVKQDPVTKAPLIISIKVCPSVGDFYEARFSVNPHTKIPGKRISYHEIKRKGEDDDTGNEGVTVQAVGELVTKGADHPPTPPKTDENAINGKKACRVLMHTDKEISDDKLVKVIGDFGVITNPPYPP